MLFFGTVSTQRLPPLPPQTRPEELQEELQEVINIAVINKNSFFIKK
jgi:hypothetical protein